MLNLLKQKSIKRTGQQQPGTDDKLHANPYTFIHTNLDHGSEDPTASILSLAERAGITIQNYWRQLSSIGVRYRVIWYAGTNTHCATSNKTENFIGTAAKKLQLSQTASTFYEILNNVR